MDNPTNGYLKTNSLLLSYISTKNTVYKIDRKEYKVHFTQ